MLYLLSSLQNLQQGMSLYPSVCVAIGILESFGNIAIQDDETEGLTTEKALEVINEQMSLVDTVLVDVTHYDGQVKEALKQHVRKKGAPPDNVESYVFAGRTEHSQTLEKLLELLEFVVLGSNGKVTIKSGHIDALWKTFVLSPNFTSDQNLFLSFLNKKRQRTSGHAQYGGYQRQVTEVHLLSGPEQKHLFTQILCNSTFVDYGKLSVGLSKCFHTYFRLINQQAGFLERSRKKIEVTDFAKLIGMDSLWSISFDSESDKARDEARELLVDLHLRLSADYESEAKKAIMQAFIDRCMVLLRASSQ
jgi:hypothetical protein